MAGARRFLRPAWSPSLGVLLACSSLAGCGLTKSSGPRSPGPAMTDSGLPNRCRVATSEDRPLVTEWSASEKARLEGLAAGQAVAVAYSGCEMRILESCRLPGRYAYRRTTLASDTLEIDDADALFAKLPLGAVSLEGELARSGRLAVRTTVAGQMALEGAPAQLPQDPGCAGATHVISAISVGSFSLLTGGAVRAGGGAQAASFGASARTSREEAVMRQAGDPKACTEGSDKAPSAMCASPIQVFLTRVAPDAQKADQIEQASAEKRAREYGVLIAIPAPKEGERWKLHDAQDRLLCEAPCERWVPPRSGYYLERQPTSGAEGVRIDVPNDLPHKPGSRVVADYGPERGMPFLSKLTFYGVGIPSGAASVGLGIAWLASGSDSQLKGFFLGGSIFYGLAAAASTWWFLYSDDKHFTTREADKSQSAWLPDLKVKLSPFGLSGRF